MNHSKFCLPELLQQNMAALGWSTLLPAQEALLNRLNGEDAFAFYAHGGNGKRSALCIWLAAMFCEAEKTTPLVRGRRPRVLIVSEVSETSAQIFDWFNRLVLGTLITGMRCGAGRDYGERRRVPLGVDLLIGPASALIRQLAETPQWFDDVKEIFFVDTEMLFENAEGAENLKATKVLLAQIARTHQGPLRHNFLFNHWAEKYEKFVASISPKAQKTRLGARYKAPDLFERFVLVHKTKKLRALLDEVHATPEGRRALVCCDRRRVTTMRNLIREDGIPAELVEDAKPEDKVVVAASHCGAQLSGMSFDRVLLYRGPESPEAYEALAALAVFPATKSRPWCGELVMNISSDQVEEFRFMSEQLAFGKWQYATPMPRPMAYKKYPDLIESEEQLEARHALCEARVQEDLAREAAQTTGTEEAAEIPEVKADAPAISPEVITQAVSAPQQASLFEETEEAPVVTTTEGVSEETLSNASDVLDTSDVSDASATGETLDEAVVERVEETVAEEVPEVTDEDEQEAAAMPVEAVATEVSSNKADEENAAEEAAEGNEEEAVIIEAIEASEASEEAEETEEAGEAEDVDEAEATNEDADGFEDEDAFEDLDETDEVEESDEADESDESNESDDEEDDYDDWEEVPADDVDAWDDVEEEPHELDYDEHADAHDAYATSFEEEPSQSSEAPEESTPHRRTLTIRSGYVPRQEYATTVTITEPLSSSTVELRASQERMRRAMRGSEKLTHQMVGKRGTVRRQRRGAEAPMGEAEGILAAKPGARLPGEKRLKKGQKPLKNRKSAKAPGMYSANGQRDCSERADRSEGMKHQRLKNKPPRQPVVDYAASEALTVPGLGAMPEGLPMDEAERSEHTHKNRQDRARNRRNDRNDKAEGRPNKKRWNDRRNSRRQQRENAPLEGAQANDLPVTPQAALECAPTVPETVAHAVSSEVPVQTAFMPETPAVSVPRVEAQPENRAPESSVHAEGAAEARPADTQALQNTSQSTPSEGASGEGKKKFKPRRNNRFQKGNKDGEGYVRRDRRSGKKNMRQRIPSPFGAKDRQPMDAESLTAPGDFPRWNETEDDNFGNSINFKSSAKRRKSANPWQTPDVYGMDRPQTLTFAQTMPMDERREGLSTSFLENSSRPNRTKYSNRPNRADRSDRPDRSDQSEGERRSNDGRKRFNNKKKFGFKNRKGPRNPNGQNGQGGLGESGNTNTGSAAGTPE